MLERKCTGLVKFIHLVVQTEIKEVRNLLILVTGIKGGGYLNPGHFVPFKIICLFQSLPVTIGCFLLW